MANWKSDEKSLWVFGYGSLCWHPGFDYAKSVTGYVEGFGRRFWQGNTTHRGTIEKPGRVATVVEDKQSSVYGRAYKIKGSEALPYLENRECSLGGYVSTLATFHSRDGKRSFTVLIYIATKMNDQWLGEAPLGAIAEQITECRGPSGHNAEYLLRLAEFMHRCAPEAQDDHLFTLETLVRAYIKKRKLCLESLMGNRKYDLPNDEKTAVQQEDEVARQPNERPFQFLPTVSGTKLRCLNI